MRLRPSLSRVWLLMAGAPMLAACDGGPPSGNCDRPQLHFGTRIETVDASGARHGFETAGDERAVLVPGTSTLALTGRFVGLDGAVEASFPARVEPATGVRGGIVIEELAGGELRQRYTNRLVRVAPDHDPRDFVRSSLTFIRIDGLERRLLADSLVFVSAAPVVGGRVYLPADDRRGAGVYTIRERRTCINVLHPDVGTFLPEECSTTERSLWHVAIDGSARRLVAPLPTDGSARELAVSADGRHAVLTLDAAPRGTAHVWVDLDRGTARDVPGLAARHLSILPDGLSLFGIDLDGNGVVANAETGRQRRVVLDPFFDGDSPRLVLVADSGIAVSAGVRGVRRVSVVASVDASAPSAPVFEAPGPSIVTSIDALPDGTRFLRTVQRVAAPSCEESAAGGRR